MRQRWFSICAALALLLALAGCGGPAAPEQREPAASEQTEPEDRAPSAASSGAIDNGECLFRLTGVDPDNIWGYTVNAELENRSRSKTYLFSVESVAVNGVQCDSLFSAELPPGQKTDETIQFVETTLQTNGITEYTDLELALQVRDAEDRSAENAGEAVVHVYPAGAERAAPYVRPTQESDQVLADSGDVAVTATGFRQDEFWGYTADLFLVNRTDKVLMFSAGETTVNGCPLDPFFAKRVQPGKCAFDFLSWFDETLAENDIQTVEEIVFRLRVYDPGDWGAEDLVNEQITLRP